MTALPLSLLPDTATVGDRGQLIIGGCDTLELAGEFGTPLFVYDEAHLRARCREAVAAFGPGVNYATKAFLCTAMARLAAEEGCNLDVSTGGEYHVARAAGVPAERLVMHGNNKGARRAAPGAVGGHRPDRRRLLRRDRPHRGARRRGPPGPQGAHPGHARRRGPHPRVHPHRPGRLQVRLRPGQRLAEQAVQRAAASPAIDLVGLHAHIGSQVFEARFFELAVEVLAPFVERHGLPELSLGGGLGVAYVEGEEAPSITEWGKAVHAAVAAAGITATVTAEPGRALVAQAAVTLYTVGTIKDLPGIRTYVAVDGGMSDNPRPVLYGSGYEAFLPRAVAADRPRTVTVVGKHCESGDVLVRDARVPADLAVGDVLATPVTGAYGHSMGSDYNKVTRPAVVFVADGDARLVVRRETLDDLLALDLG